MLRYLRLFGRLEPSDRRLILGALLHLTVAVVLVRLVPFKRWASRLGTVGDTGPLTLDDETLQRAARVAWAVNKVKRRLPWHSTCLMDAYAAQRLLVARRIPHRLILGVRYEDTDADRQQMAAHAWIMVGPVALIGGGIHREYQPVATFSR